MIDLSIDIETFSDEPIAKSGLFRYADSPQFDILLFGYSINGEPAQTLDLTKEAEKKRLTQEILPLLVDEKARKHAWNAAFEWYCLTVWMRRQLGLSENWVLPPNQWRDTMLHARYCGLPGGLDDCGKALGIPEDKQKLSVGKALIRTFSVPRTPTARDPRTRVMPGDEPEKWALYKTYNAQDVDSEAYIDRQLAPWQVPDWLQRQWEVDLLENYRGVGVDVPLVRGAIRCAAEANAPLLEEARQITGLENPNSVAQLLPWIKRETGANHTSLGKAQVEDLLEKDIPYYVRRVLKIRQELSKTSTKKYDAMEAAVCADGRIRGIMQFYGANRTGRYAGRIVQPQNLPRTHLDHLDAARAFVEEGNTAAIKFGWGDVNHTLSMLIRTALVPAPGNKFVDADFSAIEARVIAWLAQEQWVLDVFCGDGKIYEATASQMFGVPIEKIAKGQPEYELRQRGKVAQLACGYGGGAGAMANMDVGHKIDPEEYPVLVQKWRQANPRIVALWKETENAAKAALSGRPTWVQGKVLFQLEAPPGAAIAALTAMLPSGRKLFYINPKMGTNRFGSPSITYYGVNQITRKWMPLETYGGKLVENLVQAIARDILCEKIEDLEAAGFPVVFSVHDEVIIDAPPQKADLDEVVRIMSRPPEWAPDMPLNAAGWVGDYYTKD